MSQVIISARAALYDCQMPTQGIVSVRTEFVNNRGSMKASLSIFKNVQNDVTCIQPLKILE